MGFRRASIQTPCVVTGIMYRASCNTTGEILESSDLASLYRHIAKHGFDTWHTQWTITVFQPKDFP